MWNAYLYRQVYIFTFILDTGILDWNITLNGKFQIVFEKKNIMKLSMNVIIYENGLR